MLTADAFGRLVLRRRDGFRRKNEIDSVEYCCRFIRGWDGRGRVAVELTVLDQLSALLCHERVTATAVGPIPIVFFPQVAHHPIVHLPDGHPKG